MQQNVSLFNTHIGRLGRKHLLVVEGGASRAWLVRVNDAYLNFTQGQVWYFFIL